jgi:hypothetical protein
LVGKTSFLTGAKVEPAKSKLLRKLSLDLAALERRYHDSTSNLPDQVFRGAGGRRI